MKKCCRFLLFFVISLLLLSGCGNEEIDNFSYNTNNTSSYYFRYIDKEVSYVENTSFDVLKDIRYDSNLEKFNLLEISISNENLARVNSGKIETVFSGKTKVTVNVTANNEVFSSSFDLNIVGNVETANLKITPITSYTIDEDHDLCVYSIIVLDISENGYRDYIIEILNGGNERNLIDIGDKTANITNVKAPRDIIAKLRIKDTKSSFFIDLTLDANKLTQTD